MKDDDGNVIEIIPGALRIHLTEIGFDVVDVVDDVTLDKEGLAAEAKEAKKAVTQIHVDLRDVARDLNEGEALALEDKGAASPQEAAALDRYKIRKAYGIKEGQPVPRELIERDDRGRRRGKLKNYSHTLSAQHKEIQPSRMRGRIRSDANSVLP